MLAEEKPQGYNHAKNLIETRRLRLVSKSLIPRVHEVLTRDSHPMHLFSPMRTLHRQSSCSAGPGATSPLETCLPSTKKQIKRMNGQVSSTILIELSSLLRGQF